MKTLLKVLGGLLAVVVVLVVGVSVWSRSAANARLSKTFTAHSVDFPVPFPLSEAEKAALIEEKKKTLPPDAPADTDVLAGVDLNALALENAVKRGQHLVESRYACAECHGADFAGGTMIDAPPMGRLLGRNLTAGKGGVVAEYTVTDWDRLVRHGIKRDGKPTVMPAMDFFEMTDRELSDLIAYIRSKPAVDKDVPEPTFGPIGYVLLANGSINLAAEQLADHQKAHVGTEPAETSPEFGKLVAQPCVGCHGADLSGGPISGGDPSWPPALNLTPHADGLAGWTQEDFEKALLTATRKNGQPMKQPMAGIAPYAKKMTPAEMKALFAYLQSVPAKPSKK
jgi:mono/diheme cytochrome c family protein